jgi:hypothetical protein
MVLAIVLLCILPGHRDVAAEQRQLVPGHRIEAV